MPLTVPVEYVPARYRCFSCLHVRTGTLLLAVLQIIVHFIVIAILTAALGRATHFREDVEYVALSISVMSFIQWERFVGTPERLGVVPDDNNSLDRTHNSLNLVGETSDEGGTASSTTKRPSTPYIHTGKFFINAGEEYVAIAVTLLSLLFSIMMLIGTIYARPYYLLPYCCVQFVDLFVTCLSVVGYYTYLPESSTWTRSQLIMSLIVVLAGILLLTVKAYMLAMVWLCYKFLLRYASGRESLSGFSLVAGSCCLPLSFCERLGCVQYATNDTPVPSVIEEGDHFGSRRSQTSSGRIIVLLRRSTANSPSRIRPAEPCFPPKYEDVLTMPTDAYDPPPYELFSSDQQPQTNETNEDVRDTVQETRSSTRTHTIPPDGPIAPST